MLAHARTQTNDFIVKQLLLMCKAMDMDTRPGKRQLSALLRMRRCVLCFGISHSHSNVL